MQGTKLMTMFTFYASDLMNERDSSQKDLNEYLDSLNEEELNNFMDTLSKKIDDKMEEIYLDDRPKEVRNTYKLYKEAQDVQRAVRREVDEFRNKKQEETGEVTVEDYPGDLREEEREFYNFPTLKDLPSDLGKLNKSHEELLKIARPIYKKYVKDNCLSDVLLKKYIKEKISNERNVLKFLQNCILDSKNPKKFGEIVNKSTKPKLDEDKNIIAPAEDLEIDPETGKTYREFKKELFLDYMNKVNYCKQYFSVSRTDKEIVEFMRIMGSELYFCSELQGRLVYSLVNTLGLEDDPEVQKVAANICENNKMIVSASNPSAILPQFTSSLYKYGDINHLAFLGAFMIDQNTKCTMDRYGINVPEFEQYKDFNYIQGLETLSEGSYTLGYPEIPRVLNRKSKDIYTIQKENTIFSLGFLLRNKLKQDIGDIDFSIDGKKIELKDTGITIDENQEDPKKVKVDKFNALAGHCGIQALNGKDVIIRDKNGKFLMDFKTSESVLGYPIKGNLKTIDIGKITLLANQYSKTHNYDKKTGKQFVEEKVNLEIKDRLTEWISALEKFNKSSLDKKDSPMYGGVQDILKEIKADDMKDKDKIVQGLVAARTFIQGYLDETVGVKNDKDLLARQEVMNSIYMNLLNVEEEFDLQKKFHKEFDYDLTKENEVKDYLQELDAYLGGNDGLVKNEQIEDFKEVLKDLVTVEANSKEFYNGIKAASQIGKHFAEEMKGSKKQDNSKNAEKFDYVLSELEKIGHKFGVSIGEEKETSNNKKQVFENGNDPTKEEKEELIDTNVKEKQKEKEVEKNYEISTSRK